RAKNVYFCHKSDVNIYGPARYPINLVPDLKKLDTVFKTGKKTLLMIDETSLNSDELNYFCKLKDGGRVKILDLVKRAALTH
ncbi:MAG: hypothetical protein V1647_07215, partial [Pseudomonadota bacterium]